MPPSIRATCLTSSPIDPHQIRTMPSNRALVLVTRGNNATTVKPENPGALKLKALTNGQLTDIGSIAPVRRLWLRSASRRLPSDKALDARLGRAAKPTAHRSHNPVRGPALTFVSTLTLWMQLLGTTAGVVRA
jgi:hypothetical protein